MNNKALNTIVATISLIALAMALATIIFVVSRGMILNLSPPTETYCEKISFNSEIYKSGTNFVFAVVNTGNIKLGGFSIYELSTGEQKKIEDIELEVSPGRTETINLKNVDDSVGEKIIIIPKIIFEKATKEEILACEKEFGLTLTKRKIEPYGWGKTEYKPIESEQESSGID